MKTRDFIWIGLAIILSLIFFYNGGSITIGQSEKRTDFEIYCQVKNKLDDRCKFVIDTLSVLYPEDLYFEKASRFVCYQESENCLMIWYTTDLAIFEKSLDSSFFKSIIVPANLLLGEKEGLVTWIKENHKKK